MPQTNINVNSLVEDIKGGVGRSRLITKYRLSLMALQGIVSLLLDSGRISRKELYGELNQEGDTVLPDSFRSQVRHFVDFEIIVYEADRPDLQGRLRDITEDGICAIGLDSEVGKIMDLVILGDALGEVGTFEFQALCRWINADTFSRDSVSGFQIVDISESDRTELRKFLRLVTFSD